MKGLRLLVCYLWAAVMFLSTEIIQADLSGTLPRRHSFPPNVEEKPFARRKKHPHTKQVTYQRMKDASLVGNLLPPFPSMNGVTMDQLFDDADLIELNPMFGGLNQPKNLDPQPQAHASSPRQPVEQSSTKINLRGTATTKTSPPEVVPEVDVVSPGAAPKELFRLPSSTVRWVDETGRWGLVTLLNLDWVRTWLATTFFPSPQKLAFYDDVDFTLAQPMDCTSMIRERLWGFFPFTCAVRMHSAHANNLNNAEVGLLKAVDADTLGFKVTHPGRVTGEVCFSIELRRTFLLIFGTPTPWIFSFKSIVTMEKPEADFQLKVILTKSSGAFDTLSRLIKNQISNGFARDFQQRLQLVQVASLSMSCFNVLDPQFYSWKRSESSRIGSIGPSLLAPFVKQFVVKVLRGSKDKDEFRVVRTMVEESSRLQLQSQLETIINAQRKQLLLDPLPHSNLMSKQ